MNNNRATRALDIERTVRIADDLIRPTANPDGVYVLTAANHETAVVVLVVREGAIEIWLRLL